MKCLFCEKEISEKAKYCSEAHRKAYVRRTKQGEQPGQIDPDTLPRTLDFKPTRTDSRFESRKPNYYNYSQHVRERQCIRCHKDFKTRMNLLRYCSPEHQNEAMTIDKEDR